VKALNLVRALLLAAAMLSPVAAMAQRAGIGDQVAIGELPPEARSTLSHIRQGGPFQYRQDGATFSNREHRLPAHERGYYREYTIITPDARDRGARRIIAGGAGEYYYSDDHYRSFHRIRE
jgi:ribonuclease T1